MVINQHTENFGDDCAAAAVLHEMRSRFPDAEIDVVYHDREGQPPLSMPAAGNAFTEHNGGYLAKSDVFSLAAYICGLPFADRMFSERVENLLRIYGSADLIFVSPCGANIGIYKDWHFLLKIIVAVAAGATPIFHLNTIGRSGDFIFDRLALRVLRKSKVFVRERASYEYLAKAGVAAERGVDSAFALPDIGDIAAQDEVVVVATDLSKWFRSYRHAALTGVLEDMAREIGTFAAKNRLRVRLIPHLHSSGAETEFLATLAGKIKGAQVEVVVDEVYQDYRGYERRIASAQLVVSMRYHGVVLAAKNAVPFVSVAYENKMMEVSRYSGQPDMSFLISDWSSDRFRKLLDIALSDRDRIAQQLRATIPYLRQLAVLPLNFAWLSQK